MYIPKHTYTMPSSYPRSLPARPSPSPSPEPAFLQPVRATLKARPALPLATWPRLMPVPRIPTVGRCLAALPAAVPLPPRMRLALRWREPGSAVWGQGGVVGALGQAAWPLQNQPLPQAPQGRHLRASAPAPVGTSSGEEPMRPREPSPPPLTPGEDAHLSGNRSAGPAGACRVRGPAFSPAPLARPALKASPSGCAHTRSQAPPPSPEAPPLSLGRALPPRETRVSYPGPRRRRYTPGPPTNSTVKDSRVSKELGLDSRRDGSRGWG